MERRPVAYYFEYGNGSLYFMNGRGTSWQPERLSASQEGLCAMELLKMEQNSVGIFYLSLLFIVLAYIFQNSNKNNLMATTALRMLSIRCEIRNGTQNFRKYSHYHYVIMLYTTRFHDWIFIVRNEGTCMFDSSVLNVTTFAYW
jgi:hypothetical protein